MAKKTSKLGGYARWRRARRILRDSRILLKECRRLLRKNSHRLHDEVLERIKACQASLTESRKRREIESTRKGLEKLDRLLEKHLSFARKSAIREYSESIGIAVLIALLLRAFVVEAFKIPSGSMIPTLEVGDHLFVTKFIYGIRIPWTRIKFFSRKPQRGDVIVFIYPVDESKDFIKRIVAVGGDTIEVRSNVIYVNGKPVPHTRLPGSCRYCDGEEGKPCEMRDCIAFEEHLGGKTYRVIQSIDAPPDDFPPHKVPEGHVFVMGDNRDNSHDSRAWGTVPDTHIKGKALIIWYSRGTLHGIRWRRFFSLVHSLKPDPPYD